MLKTVTEFLAGQGQDSAKPHSWYQPDWSLCPEADTAFAPGNDKGGSALRIGILKDGMSIYAKSVK